MRMFSTRITVMMSKAKPKKLKAFIVPGTWKYANVSESKDDGVRTSASTPLDCDIGEIHFLVKQEAKGDLRKDARVQDLNNVINRLMASSNNSNSTLASRSRRLRVRTFAVTCLSEDTGILEWVPDTDSLRNLVHRSYNPQTTTFCPRRRGCRMTNFGDATLRSHFERAQNQFFKNGDIVQAARLYYLLCLKQQPPVLSWWFVQRFASANDWYEARTKFTLSAATWSSIGHVIGLGDRHSENILVETTTGRVIHVDFDCIFDKGLNLPRPEVVPFRLTPNMLDAFGPTGADGMFSSGMECSLEVLRKNRDTLLSVLEPFIKDPVIDWKKHRTQQMMTNDGYGEAKRSIHMIRERLSGICNLRNPNYRKYRNIIPRDHLSRVEQDNTTVDVLPLSVEGQVQKLCAEASKNENLVQLYVGWMPWI
mmetsp:Transcript_3837/g.10912  ORF Transcript_3837/g.10912 Transcript_3837/m.10912 type:complete len:423 (+) Transcript_3837:3325-4593(+)